MADFELGAKYQLTIRNWIYDDVVTKHTLFNV